MLMNTLNDAQIRLFEEQCGYVPFLMNKSKAVRGYIKGILLKSSLLFLLCVLLKWNNSFLPLVIVYCIFLVVHTYLKAFSVMRGHMINHMEEAVIYASGVVVEKRHFYPKRLKRFISRHAEDRRDADEYSQHYYSELKVLIQPHEEKWFPCTTNTYERTVVGDPAIVLKFPEEYELGSFCSFLALDE